MFAPRFSGGENGAIVATSARTETREHRRSMIDEDCGMVTHKHSSSTVVQ